MKYVFEFFVEPSSLTLDIPNISTLWQKLYEFIYLRTLDLI